MRKITLPQNIKTALDNGAHLIVSVSGGKDSDCMTIELDQMRRENNWTGDFILIHANVGERMEWPQSQPHCQDMADHVGAKLVSVQHPKGDLMDGIWRRMNTRPDAPPFPSAQSRYCTAGWKRDPISKWIRNEYPQDQDVICAMGLRKQESPARAKKLPCEMRPKTNAPTKNRNVWNWNPILDYTEIDVWDTLLPDGGIDLLRWHQRQYQDTGLVDPSWNYHPAYVYGNDRVSCAMCVLANANDLQNGAIHNPGIYQELIQIEDTSGFTFKQDKSIQDIVEPAAPEYTQLALWA